MPHLQLTVEEYQKFPQVANPTYLAQKTTLSEFEGLQKLVMLDRYSLRDNTKETLKVGDLVVCEVKYHPEYPTQGFGHVTAIKGSNISVNIEYPEFVEGIDLTNLTVRQEKVIKPVETYWEQIAYRTALGVASVEKTQKHREEWFEKFFWMLKNQYAIPGGRILYGAGSGNDVTLFNCFVLNYMEDSRKGISRHRETTMEIMSRGGGVGSNGSTLRPKDAIVVGVNGKSSGSVSWLGDLANLTDLVQQGGSRRGAQMIGLGDWHPDLILFIMSKIQNPKVLELIINQVDNEVVKQTAESLLIRDEKGKPVGVQSKDFLKGANISVLVSHDLMRAVEEDKDWTFRFPDLVNLTKEQKEYYDSEWHELGDVRKWEAKGLPTKGYHTMKATALWELINIAARYSAEPGIIFIDHCNDMSNSYYYAPLVVTNPCGEQPLPKYGVCNLIAINMALMTEKKKIKWELLKKVTHISQRFADNVIDHSFYFLPENEEMAKGERRVGKGVMGLADMMIDLELPYGSPEMLEVTDEVFNFIKEESYIASADIAEEKGSFPYYNEELFLQSGFMKTMSQHVIDYIKKKGIRNVCSLTVAPTGSTGTMVGVSTGLEPYFSFTYFRSGRLGKWVEVNTAISQRYFDENPEAKVLPEWFVASMDIGPLEHARVQSVIQRHVDSAISKTCNAPRDFTVEQNKELYLEAWRGGCKGVTVYVDGSRDAQVLSLTKEENDLEVDETASETTVEPFTHEPVTSDSSELELIDTRVCAITFDETGSMVKEC